MPIHKTLIVQIIEEDLHLDLEEYLLREAFDEGKSMVQIAEDLGVSSSTVRRWMTGQMELPSLYRKRTRFQAIAIIRRRARNGHA